MTRNNGWFKLESSSPSSSTAARPPANPPAASTAPSTPAPSVPPAPAAPKPAQATPPPAPGRQRPPHPAREAQQQLHQQARPVKQPRQPMPPKQPMPQSRRQARSPLPPVQSRLYSQTVGDRGPVLAQDTLLHETLEDFVGSTTLDRVVHTKGFGAFGYFQTTHSMREYTTASMFQDPGAQVQAATRFSLAVSTKGTADTSRNVRGFSTKFYTEDGVFDLLCNHLPVFLVRDAVRFPDSIRSLLPSPVNNLADPNRFWRFFAGAPEATHFVTWLYSDVGTVKSLRHIRAYSVNTYVWKNVAGGRTYVKYHWIPRAGEQSIDRQEAVRLAGENPDIAGQDLYSTIAGGTAVEYELYVQLMDPADESRLAYDPLDDTKVWSETDYPLQPVGRLVLNRNPDNYSEQIEKLAFAPSNLLEGMEFSDDKMLQGRSFVYPDAQRHRLGTEFRKIPINRQENWSPGDMVTSGSGREVAGSLTRSPIPKQDDFLQAGERYHSLSPQQQEHLADNLATDLAGAAGDLQQVILSYLEKAAPELAARVAEGMQRR